MKYLDDTKASRRQFIKGASALTALAVPSFGFSNEISPSLDLSSAETDDEYFALIRKQLLIPENRVYLNTGSLGPSPVSVIDKVYASMRQLESNPVSENWGDLGNAMEAVRGKIADFINASSEEILLTRNTTEGLSLIIQSFALNKADEIITTTREHGGATTGMDFVNKNKRVVVKKIELPMPATSSSEIIQIVKKAITSKTKLIILSHINTITGMVMPFAEIAKITRDKGIALIADGAQAPGLIPVDVKELGVDAYATSGHKWLMGPKETGFLYIRKGFEDKIATTFTSSGFSSYSASSGTRNVSTIIGLGAAIDFHNEVGVAKTQKRIKKIRAYCLDQLKDLNGLKIISPTTSELSSGILSFSLDSVKNSDIYNEMKKQDIIVKLLSSDNAIRISCHLFVLKKDIDVFVKALKTKL